MLRLLDTLPGAPAPTARSASEPRQRGSSRSPGIDSRAALTEAAEPWEIPVSRQDRHELDRWLVERPFRPTKPADVPEAALAALEGVCGPLPFECLFVVPRTTRLVSRNKCVITPAKVLGFGELTVALWIDDGPGGRVMSIPIDRLLAVDDRTILLYGRLRLLAADTQLVVRYNTVSRKHLQENLGELRRRMATRRLPVEPGFLWLDPRDEGLGQRDLPYKWRVLLDAPTVRPNRDEPAVIAAGDVTGTRRGRSRPPSGVAVLGSRELVIANEPSDFLDSGRYGVDLLAVPRDRLDSLGWDGRSLTVRVALERADQAHDEGAASVTLTLDRRLVEAMRRAFGSAVRWE